MYYLINHLPIPSTSTKKFGMYAIVSPENCTCSFWASPLTKTLVSADRKISNEKRLTEFVNKYTPVASAPTLQELLNQVPELLL
jgi:hypothetical protein